jgi:nucleotide-binding universal stress UspA family protein
MTSVLAVLTHECSAMACLRGADAAAALLGVTRIDVLHVRLDPMMTIVVAAEILTQAQRSRIEAETAVETAAIKALFDGWRTERVPPDEGKPLPEIAWLDVTGSPYEEVARRGRVAELIVIGAPDDGGGADAEGRQVLNATVFDTHRPFLRVPRQLPESFGRHVAVAWKEGEAARRAVIASVPWLKRAEQISVIIVAEQPTDSDAAGILELLAGHGLAGRVVNAPGGADIGGALLAVTGRLNADLLVMGAYRRPRIVEFFLGGVTADVLREARIPLLMQH